MSISVLNIMPKTSPQPRDMSWLKAVVGCMVLVPQKCAELAFTVSTVDQATLLQLALGDSLVPGQTHGTPLQRQ